MAPQPQTASLERESACFELDRFEPTGDDRLELSGRWFGVRGRRFIRPTLTILTDGSRCRVLADLDHKPWTAKDGEAWLASFPWKRDDVQVVEVELAVAPDIAVSLPPPGFRGARARTRRRRAPHSASPERNVRPDAQPPSRTVADEQREIDRLRGELERAHRASTEVSAEIARRDAAIAEFQAALAERDDGVRARDQALADRDEARRARDNATAERDEARRARDNATADRDEARRARDNAIVDRASLVRGRDRLRSERDQAVSARTAVIGQLDAVQAAADAELAQLRAELDRKQTEVRRVQLPTSESQPPPVIFRSAPHVSRQNAQWLSRALAIVILLAAIAALALVFRLA